MEDAWKKGMTHGADHLRQRQTSEDLTSRLFDRLCSYLESPTLEPIRKYVFYVAHPNHRSVGLHWKRRGILFTRPFASSLSERQLHHAQSEDGHGRSYEQFGHLSVVSEDRNSQMGQESAIPIDKIGQVSFSCHSSRPGKTYQSIEIATYQLAFVLHNEEFCLRTSSASGTADAESGIAWVKPNETRLSDCILFMVAQEHVWRFSNREWDAW